MFDNIIPLKKIVEALEKELKKCMKKSEPLDAVKQPAEEGNVEYDETYKQSLFERFSALLEIIENRQVKKAEVEIW